MRKLIAAVAVGCTSMLTVPATALAQYEAPADGSTCNYAQSDEFGAGGETRIVDQNDVDGNTANGNQEVVVYAGSGGTTATADAVAGACLNIEGGSIQGGTLEAGVGDDPSGWSTNTSGYAVFDGDNENTEAVYPLYYANSDNYVGVSNYETGSKDRCNDGEYVGSGSNSGGCTEPFGGVWGGPTPLICGDTFSDNTWNNSYRDGCRVYTIDP